MNETHEPCQCDAHIQHVLHFDDRTIYTCTQCGAMESVPNFADEEDDEFGACVTIGCLVFVASIGFAVLLVV